MRFSAVAKFALAILAATTITTVHATEKLATGDTRTVTEPVFYPVCTALGADLSIAAGEPSSETAFDTSRIQAALTACPAHQAVELQTSGSYAAFLLQPITIPSGRQLIVDGGVTVFASRYPSDYQVSGGQTCGTLPTSGSGPAGCLPLITVSHGTSGGSGVIGYGIIDGRGQDTMLSGANMGTTWWGLTTTSSTGTTQNKPLLIYAGDYISNPTNNFSIYKITLRNAPYFNVQWAGDGFTVWGAKIIAPADAPNTDGIDPRGTDMTITNSFLSDGDDVIAVKADYPAADITVSNVDTYSGHGISVGSQTDAGLNNMLVININQLGEDPHSGNFGLRLKSNGSRGGLVEDVTYENICSDNVAHVLVIDPFYGSGSSGTAPTFKNIVYKNVHVITNTGSGSSGSGQYQFQGYGADNRTSMTLDNVILDDPTHSEITPTDQYDNITLGPGPVSDPLDTQTGTDTHKTDASGYPNGDSPYPCTTANFPLLDGELYIQTSTQNNLQTLTTSASGSIILNAMVQPTKSQVSFVNYEGSSYTGVPAPTSNVSFFDGTTNLGSASLGVNGTLAPFTLNLTGMAAGTHTITARYNTGDTNYPSMTFGSVTIII